MHSVVSGKDKSYLFTFGHYDGMNRHQFWGLALSSGKAGRHWDATGAAIYSALDWIKQNRLNVAKVFPRQIPNRPARPLPACDLETNANWTYSAEGPTSLMLDVTIAFPKMNATNDENMAFYHAGGQNCAFELVRDGGSSIDSLFRMWPSPWDKLRAVYCHHHDARHVKETCAAFFKKFLQGSHGQRNKTAVAWVNGNLTTREQNMWDAFHEQITDEEDMQNTYDKAWMKLFNGMYDAWSHTPSFSRFEALFETATDAMFMLGLYEMWDYICQRFNVEEQKSLKAVYSRCFCKVKSGPTANGGNEGGVNKKWKDTYQRKASITGVLERMRKFIKNEGKEVWRKGLPMVPDVSDKNFSYYRNKWSERRGADPKGCWVAAEHTLMKYFKGPGSSCRKFYGIFTVPPRADRLAEVTEIHVPSQEVRDYCCRKVLYRKNRDIGSSSVLESYYGVDVDEGLVQKEFREVYACWLNYMKDPTSFARHIQKNVWSWRSLQNAKDYWGDNDIRDISSIGKWQLVFKEVLFYEAAFCVCTKSKRYVYHKRKELMPEIWRPMGEDNMPIDYQAFTGSCLRHYMHGFCPCSVAAGLWAKKFKVPPHRQKSKFTKGQDELMTGRYNQQKYSQATPEDMHSKFRARKQRKT